MQKRASLFPAPFAAGAGFSAARRLSPSQYFRTVKRAPPNGRARSYVMRELCEHVRVSPLLSAFRRRQLAGKCENPKFTRASKTTFLPKCSQFALLNNHARKQNRAFAPRAPICRYLGLRKGVKRRHYNNLCALIYAADEGKAVRVSPLLSAFRSATPRETRELK